MIELKGVTEEKSFCLEDEDIDLAIYNITVPSTSSALNKIQDLLDKAMEGLEQDSIEDDSLRKKLEVLLYEKFIEYARVYIPMSRKTDDPLTLHLAVDFVDEVPLNVFSFSLYDLWENERRGWSNGNGKIEDETGVMIAESFSQGLRKLADKVDESI